MLETSLVLTYTELYVSALIVQQSAKDPKTQHVVDKLFLLINIEVWRQFRWL